MCVMLYPFDLKIFVLSTHSLGVSLLSLPPVKTASLTFLCSGTLLQSKYIFEFSENSTLNLGKPLPNAIIIVSSVAMILLRSHTMLYGLYKCEDYF